MNSAVPNWICAVCLVIVALWVVEKRIQEAVLGHQLNQFMEGLPKTSSRPVSREEFRREMDSRTESFNPQQPKYSSEWSK